MRERSETEPLHEKVRRVVSERVAIVPYDDRWPEAFRHERARLLAVVPPGLIRRIEHFGSTAVPGLAAKPVIDVLVEVADLSVVREVVAPILEQEGCDYFWRSSTDDDRPPFYAWFIRRDPSGGSRTHHIHMVKPGFTEHWERLLFRDYLRSHPETAREYSELKQRLVVATRGDRLLYTQGKRAFIERVMTLVLGGSL